MGAKYSPCMRKDHNVELAIKKDRAKERETACCIRNDGSGCVQSSLEQCSVSHRHTPLPGECAHVINKIK